MEKKKNRKKIDVFPHRSESENDAFSQNKVEFGFLEWSKNLQLFVWNTNPPVANQGDLDFKKSQPLFSNQIIFRFSKNQIFYNQMMKCMFVKHSKPIN